MTSYDERPESTDPAAEIHERKRILSLDGGGIRGVITLGMLERVEHLLRERHGNPDLVLADEFDLIAGTSTGAIIAACLSWGMDVASVLELYREHGPRMFSPSSRWRRFRERYRAEGISRMFKQLFVENDGSLAELGSEKLRTLLLVVVRNASTGSAWPVTNNPHARFNDENLPDCNLKIPLWQLLRASTAAPTFFPPEEIDLGGDKPFTFIDGGITPYNNPALIALLTATLDEFHLNWPTGENRLSLVSFGTGSSRARISPKPLHRLNIIDHLSYMPPALIGSSVEQQDMLCRVMGRCVFGEPIDIELGSLMGPGPFDAARLCTYARFNPRLDRTVRMDDVSLIDEFLSIGRTYAELNITGSLLT